jgi:glycosyltransferase involved in cell wall biosynthesis
MPHQVIFINSHPVQYFAPLYKYMNDHGIPTTAWYCSDENVKGHLDRQFNTVVGWDIPVLEGYSSRFFRNNSWKPSLYNGFFGLINLSLLGALIRERKSFVVVHGWGYLTHVLAIIVARIRGHIVCLRGESPLKQDQRKSKGNRLAKRILLQGFLFRLARNFLYIGTQNRAFYKLYGVGDSQLHFAPYAVDNDRFRQSAIVLPQKQDVRKELNIPADAYVILFSGKFIDKKRPMDLLAAYRDLDIDKKYLVLVGDGELRPSMEQYISEHRITGVHLTGFMNQTFITRYYAAADVFVMCSGTGETWGLSVNEAMNFSLPLVVSDTCGCSDDLVSLGVNGYVFKEGDVPGLTAAMKAAQKLNGAAGLEIVDRFSFETITATMKGLIVTANN